MKTILLATVFLAFTSNAYALTEPKPQNEKEPRMVTAVAGDDIIALHMNAGRTFTVEACDDEVVDKRWVSDMNGMVTVKDDKFLLLKPKWALDEQPLSVSILREDGKRRSVIFQIDAIDDPKDRTTPYRLRLICPDNIARKQRIAAEKYRAEHPPGMTQAVSILQDKTSDTGVVNKHYVAVGDGSLLPSMRMWDDGQRTYLIYQGNTRIPIPYIRAPDNSPMVAPYSVGSDRIVTIEAVVRGIILRDGDAVMYIWNQNFNSIGINHNTGTIKKNVRRVLKAGK